MFPTRSDAGEQARLHDLAKCEAARLRRETVDDFWRGANTLVTDAGHGAYRSAQRLADRLARRQRSEAATVSPTPKGV